MKHALCHLPIDPGIKDTSKLQLIMVLYVQQASINKLVSTWMGDCQQASKPSTQPSIPPGQVNRLPACLAGVKAGYVPEMLSPRGQGGLEAKILASASVSASKVWPRPRPRPWPQTFGLGLASVCIRRTSSQ